MKIVTEEVYSKKSGKLFTRILDIIPGAFVWAVFILNIVLSFFIPDIVAFFIILFNVFWLQKVIRFDYYFVKSFVLLRVWNMFDWFKMTRLLTNKIELENYFQNEKKKFTEMSLRQIYEMNYTLDHFSKLPYLFEVPFLYLQRKASIDFIDSRLNEISRINFDTKYNQVENLYHIVIIPYYNEPYNVLEDTVKKLTIQNYFPQKIILVLATEVASKTGFEFAKKLKKTYQNSFYEVLITRHELKPDEIRGKAANMHYAAEEVYKWIQTRNLDLDLVTLTGCDSDSLFPINYFAMLSYNYVIDQDRFRHYYCGSMSYYANIWEVPFYIRVTNTLFSFVALAAQSKPNLIQISTYSGAFRLFESIGFWSKDVIPEDWNMFFKAVFKYGIEAKTIPLHTRILSDSAGDRTHWKSIVNQYEQVKRWSWGVSENSWLIKKYISTQKSLKDELYILYRGFIAITEHLLWPIYGFVLSIGANIPLWVNKEFSYTVFGRHLPSTISTLLTIITSIFVFVLVLDISLKPSNEKKNNFWGRLLTMLEYIFVPFTGPIFGSLPALDSHTRLMIGKRLEYRVTEKQ